ncbi:hypothetical protein BH24CHL4_BH24CHL4_08960 [soil metagenome]
MTDPKNDHPETVRLEPEQPETAQPAAVEPDVAPPEGEPPPDGSRGQGPSSQRTRTIFAGLITVAILAVLAIAIFDSGSDDDDPLETPATVVDQVATTGGDTNQQVVAGPELGSLSVTGFLCPSSSSAEETCMESGPVEILNATVRLSDGVTMQLAADMRQENGSYAWLNIPVGEYVLLADGLLGPDGAPARDVAGASGQVEDGWIIANNDPNQPAVLQVFFVPVEDGEAAG